MVTLDGRMRKSATTVVSTLPFTAAMHDGRRAAESKHAAANTATRPLLLQNAAAAQPLRRRGVMLPDANPRLAAAVAPLLLLLLTRCFSTYAAACKCSAKTDRTSTLVVMMESRVVTRTPTNPRSDSCTEISVRRAAAVGFFLAVAASRQSDE